MELESCVELGRLGVGGDDDDDGSVAAFSFTLLLLFALQHIPRHSTHYRLIVGLFGTTSLVEFWAF